MKFARLEGVREQPYPIGGETDHHGYYNHFFTEMILKVGDEILNTSTFKGVPYVVPL